MPSTLRLLLRQTHRKARISLIYKGERVMRIELTYQAWEARVLPLNYTRREETKDGIFVSVARLSTERSRIVRLAALALTW